MAGDHDDRRRLARAALAEGWTVRRTEDEARAASEAAPDDGRSARAAAVAHPDQRGGRVELAETFGRALGAAVQVTPRGEGYTVTLTLETPTRRSSCASRIGASERRRAPALSSPALRAISSVG